MQPVNLTGVMQTEKKTVKYWERWLFGLCAHREVTGINQVEHCGLSKDSYTKPVQTLLHLGGEGAEDVKPNLSLCY